jgi:hypothetical protein
VNLTLRRSIAAAVVLAVPVLSSCGFDEPTDRVYNPGVGVNDRAGTVDVLGAVVVSDSAGSGTVSATFVNNDSERADAVTRITGSGDDSGVTVALGEPLELTPGGSAKLSEESPVAAEGAPIESGAFVELTFSFERGESVTLQLPVVSNVGDYSNVPLPGSESPTGSPTGSPAESPAESPTAEESPSPAS